MQNSVNKQLMYDYYDYISMHMAQFSSQIGDIESIENYLNKYVEMTEPLRHLVVCDFLIGDVENGGFSQYYFNSVGATVYEAIAGFRAMGEEELARIVEDSLKFFTEGKVRDRAERQMQLLAGEEEPAKMAHGAGAKADAFFAPLDTRFYEETGFNHDAYMMRIIQRYPDLLT